MRSTTKVRPAFLLAVVTIIGTVTSQDVNSDDWPMLGRSEDRNSVSPEKHPPLQWDTDDVQIGEYDRTQKPRQNVKWVAKLGSMTFGDPVVADGLVWVGTNNDFGRDFVYPRDDASVLACLRESDGTLLYKYVSPRLKQGRVHDWPYSSMASSPLIERDRLWFVTNRCETVCLDIGPLKRAEGPPRVVWKLDMMGELGVFPRGSHMAMVRLCSVASFADHIYVVTGNGAAEWEKVTAPDAPSLLCLRKDTGKIIWQDNSPGTNILHGQWASPLVVNVAGQDQCIVPQGDGWVRSFDAHTGELIWKFDMNPKASVWNGRSGDRNNILATPVLYEDRVYLAVGQHPVTGGEGPGRLCCIDPSKSGDISDELAVNAAGQTIPARRLQNVDANKGEKAVANPNSGLLWDFTSADRNGDGKIQFEEQFHRSFSSVAIRNNLLMAVDLSGLVHCLDAKTGKQHWSYDLFSCNFAAPLIADDYVYVTDEDACVSIFRLSADPLKAMNDGEPINGDGRYEAANFGASIYTSPIYTNSTLYIASRSHLFAISADNDARGVTSQFSGHWPEWRGENRDNISTEKNLLNKWPDNGPPLLWTAEGLGEGIASVAISEGRVFTLGYRDEQEYVTAVSAATGAQLWMSSIGPAVRENPLMRWLGQRTPTVDQDRLYAVRSDGDLICLSVNDGRELWRKSYTKDYGTKRRSFGICDYPLVDGDRLICVPGGTDATVVALNKVTGDLIWKTIVPGGEAAGYAATVVSDGGGIRQYVTYLQKGLAGIAAEDGRVLWRYEKLSARTANSVTPIVRDDLILAYNGYGSGGTLLKLSSDGDGVKLNEEYSFRESISSFQDSTIWIGNRVHTFRNGGIFQTFDARTGERVLIKRLKNSGITSMTWADGHLYHRTSNGTVSLLDLTAEDVLVNSEFEIPDHQPAMGATNPVVAGGYLWLRDDNRLFCYDVREEAFKTQTLPEVVILSPATAKERPSPSNRRTRSVFVPTPDDVVQKMLEVADVTKKSVIYDLGSGDGRIVIAAASKYGCRAVGYEIDRALVTLSRRNAEAAGVADIVTINEADIFKVDLQAADVVAVYLLPRQLEALIPQFKQLKPGSRIVSHHFEIPGIQPKKTIELKSKNDGEPHAIHIWTAPIDALN
jgi:outer membrane protein assembly factor BamB/precorrin-6B methylase 2